MTSANSILTPLRVRPCDVFVGIFSAACFGLPVGEAIHIVVDHAPAARSIAQWSVQPLVPRGTSAPQATLAAGMYACLAALGLWVPRGNYRSLNCFDGGSEMCRA